VFTDATHDGLLHGYSSPIHRTLHANVYGNWPDTAKSSSQLVCGQTAVWCGTVFANCSSSCHTRVGRLAAAYCSSFSVAPPGSAIARVDAAVQNPDGETENKVVIYQVEEAKRYSFATGLGAEVARIGGSTTSLEAPAGSGSFSPRVSFDVSRLNFLGLALMGFHPDWLMSSFKNPPRKDSV
jgi:hypothetical protein